jgi:predicted MFS family arabinose efflux permease
LHKNSEYRHRFYLSPDFSVIITGLAVAFSLFGDMTLYTVLPIHFTSLGLSPMQVGVLLSANRWVRIATNQLAERVVRHVRPVPTMVFALLAGAAVTAVYGLAPPFVFFLIARLVWGMCWSFLRQVGVMNAIGSSTKGKIGRMVGMYNGAVRIGFVLGNFAGGLVFDALGYRRVFLLMAACSLAGVIPAILGMRGKDRQRAIHIDSTLHSAGRLEDWLIYARGFLIGAVGSGIMMSTLGHVLNERISSGLSVGTVVIGVATINGLLLALRHTFHIIGSPFLGTFIDRIGLTKTQFSLFALATLTLSAAYFPIPIGFVISMVVIFFLCETTLRLGLMVQAGIRGSKQYARLATAMDIGSAVGPVAGWTAVGLLFSSRSTFLIGASFYLLGTLLALMSKKSAKS